MDPSHASTTPDRKGRQQIDPSAPPPSSLKKNEDASAAAPEAAAEAYGGSTPASAFPRPGHPHVTDNRLGTLEARRQVAVDSLQSLRSQANSLAEERDLALLELSRPQLVDILTREQLKLQAETAALDYEHLLVEVDRRQKTLKALTDEVAAARAADRELKALNGFSFTTPIGSSIDGSPVSLTPDHSLITNLITPERTSVSALR